MERENEAMRQALSKKDLRGLSQVAAQLQAQLKEAATKEEELEAMSAAAGRLPELRSEGEALAPMVREAEELEARLRALRETEARRLPELREAIALLQPKVCTRAPQSLQGPPVSCARVCVCVCV